MRNAWWHAQRFYAKLRPKHMDDEALEVGLTSNEAVVKLPIKDMAKHCANLRVAYVPGNTFVMDLPFQSYPDHAGHFAELVVPIFNLLSSPEWEREGKKWGWAKAGKAHVDRVLALNFHRHLSSWFATALRAATLPGLPDDDQVEVVDWTDLNEVDPLAWVVFENLVVIQDRYTHPQNDNGFTNTDHGDLWRHNNCQRYVSPLPAAVFDSPEKGKAFRARVYQLQELSPPPTPSAPPPRALTLLLQAADDWPGIYNIPELYDMLGAVAADFGLQPRQLSVSADASIGTFLAAASQSRVLIGRHTSLMASAMYMRPGSMVVELLPYKWEWAGLSTLYVNLTQSIGDIHHFGWRPQHHRHAVYQNATSDRRYQPWTPEECTAQECLTVMAAAGLRVDVHAVEQLLRSKLPGVLRGDSVAALREPWPLAV